MQKQCITCEKSFELRPREGMIRFTKRRYCSPECYRKNITPDIRSKMSENGRRNIANMSKEALLAKAAKAIETRTANGRWKPPTLGKKGVLRKGVWKGDDATYNSIHRYIQENWIKTGTCENCKKETKPFGKRRFGTEWANLSHKYNRNDRDDWAELCPKCHHGYDNGTLSLNITRKGNNYVT